jgi:hypothetical protein
MAPPPAPADPEELVEEVLRRVPPDDPASLFRAALVSKRWRRLISGRGFRRRFREFHRFPPLLGFLCYRADFFLLSCSMMVEWHICYEFQKAGLKVETIANIQFASFICLN